MVKEYFLVISVEEIIHFFHIIILFAPIWNSQGINFNKAAEELKSNRKTVDNYVKEENVKSLFKYECKPTKNESNLTKFVVYVLETENTDRTRPYVFLFYRLSRLVGKYNCDLTPYGIENCEKNTIAFVGNDC